MVVARSKEGEIVSFSFRFLWGSWLRVFLQIFLVLFWLFLPSLASGAEEASSLPFETLYRWEPLSGGASLYPTSGPFRDEKLLAFSVRERVLVAVDLENGRVLFEKEYPEKCVVHAVRKGYVFFYLGSTPQVFALAPQSGRELSFPGKLVPITEGGFLVTEDRGIVKVFDPETGECLLAQEAQAAPHPVFAVGNRIFIPTRDKGNNFAGYLAFVAQDREVSPCPSLGRGSYTLYRPGQGTFPQYAYLDAPLPVLHWEERDAGGFLEFLDTERRPSGKFPSPHWGLRLGKLRNHRFSSSIAWGRKCSLPSPKRALPEKKHPLRFSWWITKGTPPFWGGSNPT
jgi:hypothetical protein